MIFLNKQGSHASLKVLKSPGVSFSEFNKLEKINETIKIRHICVMQSNFTFPLQKFFAHYARMSC